MTNDKWQTIQANDPVRGGDALLLWASAHFAATGFSLRLSLFQLGFLLRCQDGKHLLMKLEPLAHQFGLEGRHFRQLLSSQCFVERTAFARLAQLLPLGPKLIAQRLVGLRGALADLFQFGFLVVGEIQLFEEPAFAHPSHASSLVVASMASPLRARAFSVVLLGCDRLGNGDRGS